MTNLHLLPAPGQPSELVGVTSVLVRLEDGQVYACYVVFACSYLESRVFLAYNVLRLTSMVPTPQSFNIVLNPMEAWRPF